MVVVSAGGMKGADHSALHLFKLIFLNLFGTQRVPDTGQMIDFTYLGYVWRFDDPQCFVGIATIMLDDLGGFSIIALV
jgi:hypothetical protein